MNRYPAELTERQLVRRHEALMIAREACHRATIGGAALKHFKRLKIFGRLLLAYGRWITVRFEIPLHIKRPVTIVLFECRPCAAPRMGVVRGDTGRVVCNWCDCHNFGRWAR